MAKTGLQSHINQVIQNIENICAKITTFFDNQTDFYRLHEGQEHQIETMEMLPNVSYFLNFYFILNLNFKYTF